MLVKFMLIFLIIFGLGFGGCGLLIAEIVDEVKSRKAKKEGKITYWYPF